MQAQEIRTRDSGSAATALRPRLGGLRLTADALVVTAAALIGLVLRFELEWFAVNDPAPTTARAHIGIALAWVALALVALAFNRLYDEDTLFVGGGELSRVLRAVIDAAAVGVALIFITRSQFVSRSWFGMTVVLTVLALWVERVGVRGWLAAQRSRGRWRRPAVLVSGKGDAWPEWEGGRVDEFEVVARTDAQGFSDFVDSTRTERRQGADVAVVLRAREFDYDDFWRIVLIAGELGWSVFVQSPVRSVGRDRLAVRELGGHTIVRVAPPTLTGFRGVQKRAFDLVVASLLLILTAPLMVVIATTILVGSGRPVLYRQARVGAGGDRFTMFKFRTMVMGTETNEPGWSRKDDDRRTPVGSWLRRTSLDELPQLVNVVTGHMSLVGPRPEQPVFVGRFSDELSWYSYRHRIRPGMTGLAQSHGLRGDTPLGPRVEMDNWYIENWSVALDAKILTRTIVEVVRGKNAY